MWTKKRGQAKRISVDGYGVPYVVNRHKQIFKWNTKNKNWQKIHGFANDIGVSPDGDLWVIGTKKGQGGYPIYQMEYTNDLKTSGKWKKI